MCGIGRESSPHHTNKLLHPVIPVEAISYIYIIHILVHWLIKYTKAPRDVQLVYLFTPGVVRQSHRCFSIGRDVLAVGFSFTFRHQISQLGVRSGLSLSVYRQPFGWIEAPIKVERASFSGGRFVGGDDDVLSSSKSMLADEMSISRTPNVNTNSLHHTLAHIIHMTSRVSNQHPTSTYCTIYAYLVPTATMQTTSCAALTHYWPQKHCRLPTVLHASKYININYTTT